MCLALAYRKVFFYLILLVSQQGCAVFASNVRCNNQDCGTDKLLAYRVKQTEVYGGKKLTRLRVEVRLGLSWARRGMLRGVGSPPICISLLKLTIKMTECVNFALCDLVFL